MKQQTAVDFLFSLLPYRIKEGLKEANVYEKAKQMERKQIIDAVGVGSQFDRGYLYGYHDKAEQYYTQTYEK